MRTLFLIFIAVALTGCGPTAKVAICHMIVGSGQSEPTFSAPPGTVNVYASAETDPSPDTCEGADDPAIWVNPVDAERSFVVGSHKMRGIGSYDLHGEQVDALEVGAINNVDIRDGVLVNGVEVVLAVGTNRVDDALDFYQLDSVNGKLKRLEAALLRWPYGDAISGVCLYRRPADQALFVFSNDKAGKVVQWQLTASESTGIQGRQVRAWEVGEQVESCVVDDANGWFLLSVENEGIRRYNANPDVPSTDYAVIDRVGAERGSRQLRADLEGLAVYEGQKGHPEEGYIIASSQGSHTYVVYDRKPPHGFRGSFRVVGNDLIDGTEETDGLEVTSKPMPGYPLGMLILQDGYNVDRNGEVANQNYKYVSWQLIAEALAL
jgi:3-phytase